MDRLPEDTQTLYAELLGRLLTREAERGWPDLKGSFSTKRVAGRRYVYFQFPDPGAGRRQFSLGPWSPELARLMDGYREGRTDRLTDENATQRLARLLRSAGLDVLPHAPARVLEGLADGSVFQVGGVLVGSYGFHLLGHLLGVHWPGAAWRTQDVDIATTLQVAVPDLPADVPKTLDSLEMGFVPVPQLDSREPSTSYRVRGKPLRVDLITPGKRTQNRPVAIPRLRAAAAPIPFLGHLLQDTAPAAAVSAQEAVLVTVPHPARFALHKLWVSQTRSVIQQTKSGKDLHQAALLIEVLGEDRPDDLRETADTFRSSGPGMVTKLLRALSAVVKRWPMATEGAALIQAELQRD